MTEWNSHGSQPRCILLTDGGPFAAAENLTRMVNHPSVVVSPSDTWRPEGRPYPNEVQLDKPKGAILVPQEVARILREWWPRRGSSPNWDIASTCTIDGQRGLLLVEAKAHAKELDRSSTRASNRSREQIDAALAEANDGLRRLTGEDWALSADRHYQLANRIAWSWKLAALGMPTVLLYLGFLNAVEMTNRRQMFTTAADWDLCVREYSSGMVPPSGWNTPFNVTGTPLMFLIRACRQPLKTLN